MRAFILALFALLGIVALAACQSIPVPITTPTFISSNVTAIPSPTKTHEILPTATLVSSPTATLARFRVTPQPVFTSTPVSTPRPFEEFGLEAYKHLALTYDTMRWEWPYTQAVAPKIIGGNILTIFQRESPQIYLWG